MNKMAVERILGLGVPTMVSCGIGCVCSRVMVFDVPLLSGFVWVGAGARARTTKLMRF